MVDNNSQKNELHGDLRGDINIQYNVSNSIAEINHLFEITNGIGLSIERLKQFYFYLKILSISSILIGSLVLTYLWTRENKNVFLIIWITILVILCILIIVQKIVDITNKIKKEERAFKKIVDIIQDATSFYYKNMSVLEKAYFETQLARLDIVISTKNR